MPDTTRTEIDMKTKVFVLLAVITCIVLIAAGCTSSTGSATTATPAAQQATTAPQTPSATATPATSFTGTWNATWTSGTDPAVATTLIMTQTGSAVIGTYSSAVPEMGSGSVTGTIQGNILTGSWNETYSNITYSGPFRFTISADGNTFTGTWASDSNGANGLSSANASSWNGVRV